MPKIAERRKVLDGRAEVITYARVMSRLGTTENLMAQAAIDRGD